MSEQPNELTKDGMFEAMIRYHCLRNLLPILPYLNEDKLPKKDVVLGIHENRSSKGAFLVYDGEAVLEKVRPLIARERTGVHNTVDVHTYNELIEFIQDDEDDVVHLVNTEAGKVTRVISELRNNCDGSLDDLLEESLPPDFVSLDCSKPVTDVGTKTAIAVLTARKLGYEGVRTLIVKVSEYSCGCGKVAEFDENGLMREFYFRYDPEHTGPFIDAEHKIVGVCREYTSVNGRVELCSERIAYFNRQGEIEYTPMQMKSDIAEIGIYGAPQYTPDDSEMPQTPCLQPLHGNCSIGGCLFHTIESCPLQ